MCLQDAESGTCSNFVTRWFFNESSYQCEEFGYGGCGGNSNNFDTQSTCETECDEYGKLHQHKQEQGGGGGGGGGGGAGGRESVPTFCKPTQ